MKILVINPKLKVYKDHIDYPYYLNINLYLNIFSFLENFKINIDIFDSFTTGINNIEKLDNYYTFGGDFNKNGFFNDYDYIFINFSPFILYNKINIKYINDILNNYSSSKIIYINAYTGGFCYINYKINHLLDKGLKKGILLNGNIDKKLHNILGLKQKKTRSINLYSKLKNKIDFNSYFIFLKKISNFGLTDFYKIEGNTMPFFTSKGCIFNCSFCTSSNKSIKGFYYYDLSSIESEILYMKNKLNVTKIIILDALFNKDIIIANKILDIFIKYDLKIEIPNGVRLDLLDENLIKKLSKLITKLSISIESGNKEVNNNIIGKGLNLNKVKDIGKFSTKYGLNLVSHYIIGFPEETKKDINDTLKFAYDLYEEFNIFPLLQFATPLPGTRLGDNTEIDLYKINLFEKFQTHYLLKSKNFTKEELIIFKNNFYKKIKVSKTKKIIINLTYACINNCVFCATGDRYKLSQNFSYVIAQLLLYYKKGVKLLDLDGGEPTLYKELFQVIKIAKKIGYKTINITSSGRKYKDIDYLQDLLDTKINSLLVSIHGTNAETHDEITGKKGSFVDTTLGLNNIVKLRKNNNFSFGINMTLCKINENNFEEYLLFINEWTPDTVNIQFLTPFGNANDLKGLEQDTEKCCIILKKIIPQLKYKIQLINLPFCFIEGFEEYVIGDINKMERDMIFVGETPSNLYDYLAVTRKIKNECHECNYKIICDGIYKF